VSDPAPSDDVRLAELMRKVQEGDRQAYADLLNDITPRLRRFVQRQRKFFGRADVEDVVQDILLSLHAVRATYDARRPFMPWLLSIARNRLVDQARRYARRAANEIQVDDFAVTFVDEPTNSDWGTFGDPEALRNAIKGLPVGQRQAIEMLKLREMSLKEVAAATGTSVGALKVSVHRAIAALRKTLIKDR